jgi:hypothetical protein
VNFGNPSGTAVASAVWSATIRKLTSLLGVLVPLGSASQSLAASSSIVFQPAATTGAWFSVAAIAGAAGTAVIGLTDQVTNIPTISLVAGTTGGQHGMVANNSVYPFLINNDATHVVTYHVSRITIV